MAKLQLLWMSGCGLRGTLPASWGTGFPSLFELRLRFNAIGGDATRCPAFCLPAARILPLPVCRVLCKLLVLPVMQHLGTASQGMPWLRLALCSGLWAFCCRCLHGGTAGTALACQEVCYLHDDRRCALQAHCQLHSHGTRLWQSWT